MRSHTDRIDGPASRWPRLPSSGDPGRSRYALAYANAILAQRAAPVSHDETRLSDILHSAEWRQPERPRPLGAFRDLGGGIMEPVDPTRADERQAVDRALRKRDGQRIAVPPPAPVATAESVRAEIRASRAAERMVRRERWRDLGNGIVEPDDVPAAETERALAPRQAKQTPRGVPARIITDADGRTHKHYD